MLGLFKRSYTIRHYTQQTIKNGYAYASHTDTIMKIDVQPLSADELLNLPEGERAVKRLKAYGLPKLTPADEANGIPGDRLYYYGGWYECTSALLWDWGMLAHYKSEFVILPPGEQESPPLVPPAEPEVTPP